MSFLLTERAYLKSIVRASVGSIFALIISVLFAGAAYADCYDPLSEVPGTIGTSGVCSGMLIVNKGVLETAKNTGYAIDGPDENSYTFTDSAYNVFTGQITDFSWVMFGAGAGDINYWDVSNATNMSGMFQSDFNGNISSWNVSSVTNMAMMFRNNSAFNQDLSSWNVSKVTQMQEMFSGATAFDGDVSSWDVSGVTQAHTMFKGAEAFNQDLSSWDVSGVSDMRDMFNGAKAFNGDISSWDVSNVTNMNNMFNQASAFNQNLTGWDVSYFSAQPSNFSAYATSWVSSNQPDWPNEPTDNCYKMSALGTIGTSGVCSGMLIVNKGVLETAKNTGYAIDGPDENSYTFTDSAYNVFTGQITDFSWVMFGAGAGDINYWDVSNATNMSGMFQSDFNGNISSWNVSSVTNMAMMFRNNSAFNQDLSSWNVSKVTQMQEMFSGATAFDGDVSSWDVSGVTQAHTMFKGAEAFNQDLSSWDVSGVSDMRDMFNGAKAFNGDISSWDVSNVTNMNNMFNQASAFNQNLTGWDVSYFSAQPSNFSAYATSWVSSNQPDWGYPGLASTNPVDDAAGIALNSNITLTFSEDIQAGTGNITLFKSDGSIVQAFDVSSDVSISSATITLVPTADLISETSYYIQVDATTVEDLSSNAFPGIADSTTLNFTAGSDTTLPTLVSSNPSDDATGIALSSNITLNFSETIQAGTGNITLFNSDGTIFQAFDVTRDVSMSKGSATVNPTAQLSLGGSYYIQVDATAVADLSSNAFAGIADNTTLNFAAVADTVAPTVTLTSTASVFSGLFTVTAAFSEAVTGFEVGDITVGNGSASNFDDTAAPVYTFDVTPTADGAVTVDVAGSVAIDAAGNNNTAATQLSVTADATPPTVTLTGPSDEVVTDDFIVMATFSEAVTGFELVDINVTNGVASALASTNALIYTFTVTPDLGTTVSVLIAENKVIDVAGNGNTASNTFSIQAGSPASAFEERKEIVEVAVKTEVQKALTTNLAANQRMLSAGMGRFVANKRSISSGQPQVNLFIPFDVDGNASYSDQKLKANGDFFALSSTNDGKSQKAVFGDFDVISDSDGNTSGYFNGRFAIETTVSDDLMLAYFAGASIGRALMDGTFKGSQNSYGLSVGGYFVRSFNDTVYVNGFASLGQSNHKLEIADDTLDLNSSYSTRTATLGGTVTGVMPQAGYEIWPELGFTYANTKVGTMDFTGTAYGLTADNLSLDGGAVEMGNVSFAPQFKVQFSEALIEDYASTFSITPKVTCEKVRNTTTTKGCGTGATRGLQSASDDGMTNLNVGFEYADVNNLKRRSLKLSVEHRF